MNKYELSWEPMSTMTLLALWTILGEFLLCRRNPEPPDYLRCQRESTLLPGLWLLPGIEPGTSEMTGVDVCTTHLWQPRMIHKSIRCQLELSLIEILGKMKIKNTDYIIYHLHLIATEDMSPKSTKATCSGLRTSVTVTEIESSLGLRVKCLKHYSCCCFDSNVSWSLDSFPLPFHYTWFSVAKSRKALPVGHRARAVKIFMASVDWTQHTYMVIDEAAI